MLHLLHPWSLTRLRLAPVLDIHGSRGTGIRAARDTCGTPVTGPGLRMRAVIGWRLATTNIVIIPVTGGTAGGAGTVTAIVGSAMDGTGIATTTDAGTDSYSTALSEATINVQAVGGVTEDRWRKENDRRGRSGLCSAVDFGFHDVAFGALDEANNRVLLGGGNPKVVQGRVDMQQERGPVVLGDAHTFVRNLHVPADVQYGTAGSVTQEVDQELDFAAYTVFAPVCPEASEARVGH
jgi:hypothetical protein